MPGKFTIKVMIRVIINGDDFGISQNVNKAICECFAKRYLTGTTLMVNMPYAEEAVEMAREYGFHEAVGLHLNLTSGMPLTEDIKRCKRFCRKNGTFNAHFAQNTMSRLLITKEESRAVAKEIEAQMRRYFELGLAERHLDSHHHVHTDRSVMQVLMPLVHKYNFRSVRLSRNLFLKMNFLKRIYKSSFNNSLKSKVPVTTDYFGSYADLRNLKGSIPDNSLVEVMVHPMYDEKGVMVDSHETPMRDLDTLLDELRAERQAYYLV